MSSGFIIAKQNQYLRRFQEAGAISPDTAATLEQVGCRDSQMFKRLVRREVIRQTEPGKFYLDVAAAQAFQQARRQRAMTALLIVVILAVILFYLTTRM